MESVISNEHVPEEKIEDTASKSLDNAPEEQTEGGNSNKLILPFQPIILSDRMNMEGFKNIAKNLRQLHPAEVEMTLAGLSNVDEWDHHIKSVGHTNPSYSYYDYPMKGWRKDVTIRMSGKTMGDVEVFYYPPNGTRRLRGKADLATYLSANNLPPSYASRFDYKTVFCVCQKPEEQNVAYIECSFGMAGCKGWLHPGCVGLHLEREEDCAKLGAVVCPLCACYLDGCGEAGQIFLENKRVFRQITSKVPPTLGRVGRFDIEEGADEHTMWGLEDTSAVYFSSAVVSKLLPVITSSSSSSMSTNVVAATAALTVSSAAGAKPVASALVSQPEQKKSSAPVKTQGILQHRLFDGLIISAPDGVTDSNSSNFTVSAASASATIIPKSATTCEPASKEDGGLAVPEVDKVNAAAMDQKVTEKEVNLIQQEADNDDDEVEFDDSVLPRDRKRRAKVSSSESGQKYVTVSVEGGWMGPREGQSQSGEPAKKRGYGEAFKSTAEARELDEMTGSNPSDPIATRVLQRAEALQKEAQERGGQAVPPPDVRYRRAIVDAALAHANSKRKRDVATAANSRLSASGRSSSFPSSAAVPIAGESDSDLLKSTCGRSSFFMKEAPLTYYLPLEDGGLRKACVLPGNIAKCLHEFCAAGHVCGYCLAPFDSLSQLPGSASKKKWKKQKKDKMSATQKIDDGPNISYIENPRVEVVVGAVYYSIHVACKYAMEQTCYDTRVFHTSFAAISSSSSSSSSSSPNPSQSTVFLAKNLLEGMENIPATLNDDTDGASNDEDGERGDSNAFDESLGPDGGFRDQLITRGAILAYTDEAEASTSECTLCGRSGGILQSFLLSKYCSRLNSPRDDKRWLAHVPCLYWLQQSSTLRMHYPFPEQREAALTAPPLSSPSLAKADGDAPPAVVAVESVDTEENATTLPPPVSKATTSSLSKTSSEAVSEKVQGASRKMGWPSLFDCMFGLWRCSLCGNHAGITLRCCNVMCTVRAHPLCVEHAAGKWTLVAVSSTSAPASASVASDRQSEVTERTVGTIDHTETERSDNGYDQQALVPDEDREAIAIEDDKEFQEDERERKVPTTSSSHSDAPTLSRTAGAGTGAIPSPTPRTVAIQHAPTNPAVSFLCADHSFVA